MGDFISLTKSMGDYLEVMYRLEADKGVIKVTDIAEELKVKPPSVVQAVSKISKMNMVSYERYGEIKLNEKGIKIAKEILYKHNALKNFLSILDVVDETAEIEACAMEHILSNSTINQIEKFTEFVAIHKDNGHFTESFNHYKRHNELPDRVKFRH